MIELPRAALTADKIAEVADFFSFGTNDLTQTVFGLSRDDAGKFLPHYVEQGILPKDPFVSIDVEGVGAWCGSPPRRAAATKPDLKLGICGEHGGDPASIAFCEQVGLDYVSCSPTACRWRGWRRRRRRWGRRRPDGVAAGGSSGHSSVLVRLSISSHFNGSAPKGHLKKLIRATIHDTGGSGRSCMAASGCRSPLFSSIGPDTSRAVT